MRWNRIPGYLSEEQLVEDILFLIFPDVTLKPATPESELVLCPPEIYEVSCIEHYNNPNRSPLHTMF